MSRPPHAAQSARTLAHGFSEFALRLLKRLPADETGNVFVSPFGIAAALLTLREGAAGGTRRALTETLSLRASVAGDPGEAYEALLASVAEGQADGDELFVANSLWARDRLTLLPDFVAAARSRFGMTVSTLAPDGATAARTINDWVKEKTSGRIGEMISPGGLGAATLLVLLSAVHFKGAWKTRFDESRTKAGEFYLPGGGRKSVPLMSRLGTFKHFADERLSVIELPYGGDRRSMLIFLPPDEAAFRQFLSGLSLRSWRQRLASLSVAAGEVALPRFDLCYEVALEDALRELGAAVALDPGADFSALCDAPAFVSEVRHKAAIKVTEEGTIAAAATSAVMGRSLAGRFRIVVDRPFVCVVKDNATDAILFAGAITNP